MRSEEKQQFIRFKAGEHQTELNEKILWSLHAVRKLRTDQFRKSVVEDSLKECVLIEDYDLTEGRPLPSCLVLGFVGDVPIHAVLALDETFDRILIVTVYRPSEGRWEYGWKKRKL